MRRRVRGLRLSEWRWRCCCCGGGGGRLLNQDLLLLLLLLLHHVHLLLLLPFLVSALRIVCDSLRRLLRHHLLVRLPRLLVLRWLRLLAISWRCRSHGHNLTLVRRRLNPLPARQHAAAPTWRVWAAGDSGGWCKGAPSSR